MNLLTAYLKGRELAIKYPDCDRGYIGAGSRFPGKSVVWWGYDLTSGLDGGLIEFKSRLHKRLFFCGIDKGRHLSSNRNIMQMF